MNEPLQTNHAKISNSTRKPPTNGMTRHGGNIRANSFRSSSEDAAERLRSSPNMRLSMRKVHSSRNLESNEVTEFSSPLKSALRRKSSYRQSDSCNENSNNGSVTGSPKPILKKNASFASTSLDCPSDDNNNVDSIHRNISSRNFCKKKVSFSSPISFEQGPLIDNFLAASVDTRPKPGADSKRGKDKKVGKMLDSCAIS